MIVRIGTKARIGTGGGLNRGAFQDFVNCNPSLSPQCIDMVVVAWWKLTPTKSRACCGGCSGMVVVMVAVDTNKKVKCRRWVAMIGTQHPDY